MRAWNETSPQTSLGGELKMERVKILHVHFSNMQHQKQPLRSLNLLCFLLPICCSLFFFQSAPIRAVLGKWTGTTEFHSNSGLLSRSPFSGASIISKQLSPQPVPRPNCDRPINGQLCVWIWAALLNSGVCQYLAFTLHLSFSCCHSRSPFLFLLLANKNLPSSAANKPHCADTRSVPIKTDPSHPLSPRNFSASPEYCFWQEQTVWFSALSPEFILLSADAEATYVYAQIGACICV